MRTEREVGVESDTKDLGFLDEWNLTIEDDCAENSAEIHRFGHSDFGLVMMFVGVRREEGDAGLAGGDVEIYRFRPFGNERKVGVQTGLRSRDVRVGGEDGDVVCKQSFLALELREVGGEEIEERRAEDGALWHTEVDVFLWLLVTVVDDGLLAPPDEGGEPVDDVVGEI